MTWAMSRRVSVLFSPSSFSLLMSIVNFFMVPFWTRVSMRFLIVAEVTLVFSARSV